MAAPIAPSALTGSPTYRWFLPSGIPNTSVTAEDDGENAWGKDDTNSANGSGFVRAWNAATGSIASSNLTANANQGFVLDNVGGLCIGPGVTGNTAGTGHLFSTSSSGSARSSTFVFVCSAPFHNVSATDFDTTNLSDTGDFRCLFSFGDGTNEYQIGMNRQRQVVVRHFNGSGNQNLVGSYTNIFVGTQRFMASTQVLVVRMSASSVKVQFYASGALTTGDTFSALTANTGLFIHWVGNTGSGSKLWHGPIRGYIHVTASVSDSDAAGLAEYMLQQCGLGMGATTETTAITLCPVDSWGGGIGPGGFGTVAGFLAEALAGVAVVDTLGVGGSTTAFWASTSPDRHARLAPLTERFPGHRIAKHFWIGKLGVNDCGLSGVSPIAVATYKADFQTVINKNSAIGGQTLLCGIPGAANSASWNSADANAAKNRSLTNGIAGYNQQIRLLVPSNRIIPLDTIGSYAVPPSLASLTDAILQKQVRSLGYQSSPNNNSTRLVCNELHGGRELHQKWAWMIVRALLNIGAIANEGAALGGGGGYSRGVANR